MARAESGHLEACTDLRAQGAQGLVDADLRHVDADEVRVVELAVGDVRRRGGPGGARLALQDGAHRPSDLGIFVVLGRLQQIAGLEPVPLELPSRRFTHGERVGAQVPRSTA